MGLSVKATEVRPGTKLEIDGDIYNVLKYEHHKPGKGQAVVRLRIKNIKTGKVLEKTVRSGEDMEKITLEPKQVQFMYRDEELHFMDNDTYEQFALLPEALMGKDEWLLENMDITLLFYKGEPVDVEIPMHVEMTVAETDPGFKGDTVTGGTKPATLETGVVVQVPLFINVGEKIRVDTRDGSYIERVKE